MIVTDSDLIAALDGDDGAEDAAAPRRAKRQSEKAEADDERGTGKPRRWLAPALLLGFSVLFGGGAAAYVQAQRAEVWEARAEVQHRGGDFVETAAEALGSRGLIASVSAEHDYDPVEVGRSLVVHQVPYTEVIELSYRDEDPDIALEVLDNLLARYQQGIGDNQTTDQIEVIDAELERLSEEIEPLVRGLSATRTEEPATPREQAALTQLATLRARVGDLETRRTDLELELIDETPLVLTAPYVMPDPVSPSPTLVGAAGALAGAVVGALLLLLPRRNEL